MNEWINEWMYEWATQIIPNWADTCKVSLSQLSLIYTDLLIINTSTYIGINMSNIYQRKSSWNLHFSVKWNIHIKRSLVYLF